MKRFLAAALCVLLLVVCSACTPGNTSSDVPPVQTTPTPPTLKDATGSIFVGSWTVSAKVSILDSLTFNENGTIQALFDSHKLAGTFYDDGSKLTLIISQKTLEGTYTVDGDVITVVTENDVLVLKKA